YDPLEYLSVPYTAAELVIAVLATVGNILVCVAIIKNKQLQTVTNYFLVSLAIADICVGSIAIPCAIMTSLGIPQHNLYLCVLMLSVLIMFMQSSIFSLLAIAVERYIAVVLPFQYQNIMTHRNAIIIIIMTWIVACLIGLVPMMGWHKPLPESGFCFFAIVVDMNYVMYFSFLGGILTPLILMFIIYARIFIEAKRQIRRIAADTVHKGRHGKQTASMKKEIKTATSLFLVLFLFTVCWIPLYIMNFCSHLCPQCYVPLPLTLTAIILSHGNSVVNPVLYAYRMKSFRYTFKAIF
uniref:Adenosine receptor B1a n=2 Tax=Latimeria chalumnae TaxID=7897 RepID=H3AAX6_LATCH